MVCGKRSKSYVVLLIVAIQIVYITTAGSSSSASSSSPSASSSSPSASSSSPSASSSSPSASSSSPSSYNTPTDPPIDYSEKYWTSQCLNGKKQSPIDISRNSTSNKVFDDLNFDKYYVKIISTNYQTIQDVYLTNYHNYKFMADVSSLGGSIKIRKNGYNYSYNLEEINLHYSTEHTFDGQKADLEMQLIHSKDKYYLSKYGITSDPDKTNSKLIISILFKEDPDAFNINIYKFNLASHSSIDSFDVNYYTLPTRNFYFYEGSLTLPDCSETVNWIVMSRIEYLSPVQLADYKKWIKPIYPYNNTRSTKTINARSVYNIINSLNGSTKLDFSIILLMVNIFLILIY